LNNSPEGLVKRESLVVLSDRLLFVFICLFVFFSLFSIAGTQISMGFVVLLWIIRMAADRRWSVKSTTLDYAFAAFVLACVLSTLFSSDPGASLLNLKNLLLIITVYMLSSLLAGEKQIRVVIDIFICTSALVAAVGLATTDIFGGSRVRALQSVTMTWGAMSAMICIITLSLFLFGARDRKRWFYLGAFGIQFISMLFSYVRGAWLGFAGGVLVLAFLKSKKLLVAALVLLVVVFVLAPAPVKTRILSITDLSVNSTRVRLVQWSNAVKIFRDHPIVGVGWIDLNEIHRAYAPPGADLTLHEYNIGHFHNNFIMFAVYLGIIGLAAALFMVFSLFRGVYRIYRQASEGNPLLSAWVIGALAALRGFWINGCFDWTFGDAEAVTIFWIVIGITLAVDKIGIGGKAGVG
jgi:O-antigen ligase